MLERMGVGHGGINGLTDGRRDLRTHGEKDKTTEGLIERGTDGSDWRKHVGNADEQMNAQWAGRTNARSE